MRHWYPHLSPKSLVCIGLLLLPALDPRLLSAQPDVPLVVIEATVTNSCGEVIRGLTGSDFSIRDNGWEVEVLSCEQPIGHAIALVADRTSLQLVPERAQWNDLKRGLSRLGSNDRVALLLLEQGNMRWAQNFTTDTKAIIEILETDRIPPRRVKNVQPVFDAVAMTAKAFPSREARTGRVIIVLSNGDERGSQMKADQAADEALKAWARVRHVMLIRGSHSLGTLFPWPLPPVEIPEPRPPYPGISVGLAALVRQTGGMQMAAGSSKEGFTTLLRHLRDEYLLSYVQPSPNRGGF